MCDERSAPSICRASAVPSLANERWHASACSRRSVPAKIGLSLACVFCATANTVCRCCTRAARASLLNRDCGTRSAPLFAVLQSCLLARCLPSSGLDKLWTSHASTRTAASCTLDFHSGRSTAAASAPCPFRARAWRGKITCIARSKRHLKLLHSLAASSRAHCDKPFDLGSSTLITFLDAAAKLRRGF